MSATSQATPRPIPRLVNLLNPLVRRLLALGVPMGPNVLMRVRGRASGVWRTFPVAILENDGRRVVFSPFGEVQWVRNLRASGEAIVRRGRRDQPMIARELTPEEAAPLLRLGVLPVLSAPVFGPMIVGWYGVDRDSTDADFLNAARRHPAFELRAVS